MPNRFHVLACDYDGTIAHHGRVDEPTIQALERCKLSGRKLLLVTGRELEELLEIFPRAGLFDLIVGENGALLYDPQSKNMRLLAEAPPADLVNRLRERGVAPMSVGHAIIATWRPHETAVLECIRDLSLEMQVIFNKDAVMILPSGVNKASGLEAALAELGLSPHNAAAVGDAENDHTFLSACEFGCAVENALPALKERADLVTRGDHGRGVAELIELLVNQDLAGQATNLKRHRLVLGSTGEGDLELDPHNAAMLVSGSSGSGKSTLTTGFLETLSEHRYQFCIVDPEGDYSDLENAVVLGDRSHAPGETEVIDLLSDPNRNAVVNLLGVGLNDRPHFFEGLYPKLMQLRNRTGRPHWIVIDEAHHLLPRSWNRDSSMLQDLRGTLLITVHPEHIPPDLLKLMNTFVLTGDEPGARLAAFSSAVGAPVPEAPNELPPGTGMLWKWQEGGPPLQFQPKPPAAEHARHSRKYAEGELDPERSFYFRGPEGKLNLRAQNLILFNQLAEGIDQATWDFHLQAGDYSRWFRDSIGDNELAAEAERIEQDGKGDTRERIREAIERNYTLPA